MTWKICIRGLVQGVGFRPFVWRTARDKNLKGSVANGLDGVVIKLNGTAEQAIDFQEFVLKNAPPMARITNAFRELEPETFFDSFTIVESDREGLPRLLLTPDIAVCAECRHEIQDPANRRYRYAFTTCTVCGPRYSILTGVPYDRPFTTMRPFEMCEACRAEYTNPADRRFFAQTNSCQDCGIRLHLFDGQSNTAWEIPQPPVDQASILQQVVAAWQKGAIVAIKGIGGYLLTADAGNAESIAALRSRKQRPLKPFALMYPDLASLQKDAIVPETAQAFLESPAAPIVLLELLERDVSGLDRVGIAPGLSNIGAMLPNAPLLERLLHDFGGPIIATSGNVSHTPLVYEDEAAITQLSTIADYILQHDRDIVMPQDDSVVALRKLPGLQNDGVVVLRRARGLAPGFLQPGLRVSPDETVLALGAEMKGTFALAHLGNVNVSQYLGDLSDFDTQERFRYTMQHLLRIFEAKPHVIIGDLHPGYFTTQLGQALAAQWRVPFYRVQHHEAHFAAVLAENNLIVATEAPVLGVIWDGTGLGADGQIWGGEFFVFSNNANPTQSKAMQRITHFDYFPLFLGDKMPREPRLSALSICFDIAAATDVLKAKFSDKEWSLYQKLPLQSGQLMCSSVGRIFDAVASLLGLADKVTYEGEAAMLLEDLARGYCNHNGFDFEQDYLQPLVWTVDSLQINTKELFQQIIKDLNSEKAADFVAAKFHFLMVKIIQAISKQLTIKKIAFSGGVFQNTLLLDMIEYHLGPENQLFFHQQLSPNDENISFGQWAHFSFLQQAFQPI